MKNPVYTGWLKVRRSQIFLCTVCEVFQRRSWEVVCEDVNWILY